MYNKIHQRNILRYYFSIKRNDEYFENIIESPLFYINYKKRNKFYKGLNLPNLDNNLMRSRRIAANLNLNKCQILKCIKI